MVARFLALLAQVVFVVFVGEAHERVGIPFLFTFGEPEAVGVVAVAFAIAQDETGADGAVQPAPELVGGRLAAVARPVFENLLGSA